MHVKPSTIKRPKLNEEYFASQGFFNNMITAKYHESRFNKQCLDQLHNKETYREVTVCACFRIIHFGTLDGNQVV